MNKNKIPKDAKRNGSRLGNREKRLQSIVSRAANM